MGQPVPFCSISNGISYFRSVMGQTQTRSHVGEFGRPTAVVPRDEVMKELRRQLHAKGVSVDQPRGAHLFAALTTESAATQGQGRAGSSPNHYHAICLDFEGDTWTVIRTFQRKRDKLHCQLRLRVHGPGHYTLSEVRSTTPQDCFDCTARRQEIEEELLTISHRDLEVSDE